MRINIVATPEGDERTMRPDDLCIIICDLLRLDETELNGNRIVMSQNEGHIRRLTFELVRPE